MAPSSTASWVTASSTDAPMPVRIGEFELKRASKSLATYAAEIEQWWPCTSMRGLAKKASTFHALGMLPPELFHDRHSGGRQVALSLLRRRRYRREKRQLTMLRIAQRRSITEAIINYNPAADPAKVLDEAYQSMRLAHFIMWEQDRAHQLQQRSALSASHYARRQLTASIRNVWPIPRFVLGGAKRSPLGLENPGNYCYRRSVLSALLNTPIFVHLMLDKNCLAGQGRSEQRKRLIKLLRACTGQYWGQQNQNRFKQLVQEFDQLCRHFVTSAYDFLDSAGQDDAHSFFLWLVDELLDSLPHGSARRRFRGVFKTKTQATWTCEDCHTVHAGPLDDQSSLSLSVDKLETGQSVELLLERYFATERMEIRCDSAHCQQHLSRQASSKDRERQPAVLCAPEILVVHLMRFGVDSTGSPYKKHIPVEINKHINLAPFTRGPVKADPEGLNYTLAATVAHSGSYQGGHYKTWARGPGGDVHQLNDSIVTFASEESLYTPQKSFAPYILVYTCDRPMPERLQLTDRELRKDTEPTRWHAQQEL